MGAYYILEIFDKEIRTRGKCDGCGMVRLRTRIRMKTYRKDVVDRKWCNECLSDPTRRWADGSR